jgi:hypothetical protein
MHPVNVERQNGLLAGILALALSPSRAFPHTPQAPPHGHEFASDQRSIWRSLFCPAKRHTELSISVKA